MKKEKSLPKTNVIALRQLADEYKVKSKLTIFSYKNKEVLTKTSKKKKKIPSNILMICKRF